VPPHFIVLPTADRGGAHQVVPVSALDIAMELHRMTAEEDSTRQPGEPVPHLIRNTVIPGLIESVEWKKCYRQGIDLTWPELVADVRESALGFVFAAMREHSNGFHYPTLRLFRSVYDVISGHPKQRRLDEIKPDSSRTGARLRYILKKTCGRQPRWLTAEATQGFPQLIMHAHKRPMPVFRLQKGFSVSKAGQVPEKIQPEHFEAFYSVPNPFHRIVEKVARQVDRIPEAAGGNAEDQETLVDRSFLETLQSKYHLPGKGPYQDFSIQYLIGKGQYAVRLSHTIGSRPFLQQVIAEPTFVYWDLKRFPVTVFCEQLLSGNPMINLEAPQFIASSMHGSICRHAFVKPIHEYFNFGSVCTERTSLRILGLHRRLRPFDPAHCLLEQLRAAGRILRYGIRERDRGISIHNPFDKVPEKEYQAVIRGYDEARAFAARKGAEIVYYSR